MKQVEWTRASSDESTSSCCALSVVSSLLVFAAGSASERPLHSPFASFSPHSSARSLVSGRQREQATPTAPRVVDSRAHTPRHANFHARSN